MCFKYGGSSTILCGGSVDEIFNKDTEELLSYIQLQYSTIASIERA